MLPPTSRHWVGQPPCPCMSKAAWVACRAATAVAIALLVILILRPESPFRAVLAGYLVVCLPTFRRKMMRQRLLLVTRTTPYLSPEGREEVFRRQLQSRVLESALDERGWSSTVRAVMARLG